MGEEFSFAVRGEEKKGVLLVHSLFIAFFSFFHFCCPRVVWSCVVLLPIPSFGGREKIEDSAYIVRVGARKLTTA